MLPSAQYWIDAYQMQPHPEGGYFVETYRAPEILARSSLLARFAGDRPFSTGIYFLLESVHFSALHRIQSDEMWHFYAGGPLDIYVIDLNGMLEVIRLGNNPDGGQVFQTVIPAGCWFGAKPTAGTAYTLVGCTVAPGFDFEEFELARREELNQHYPQHQEIITQLTRH